VANHLVANVKPYCDLRHVKDNEKIWQWLAPVFAEGTAEDVSFALKFETVELAAKYKRAFDDAKAQVASKEKEKDEGNEAWKTHQWNK
jgi:hypothetical protein